MHMIQVIGAGVLLLIVFTLFGKLWGHTSPSIAFAAKAFVPTWLVIALVNMWVGVTKAGYTVQQELPILLVVFLVPAALAVFAIWHFAKG